MRKYEASPALLDKLNSILLSPINGLYPTVPSISNSLFSPVSRIATCTFIYFFFFYSDNLVTLGHFVRAAFLNDSISALLQLLRVSSAAIASVNVALACSMRPWTSFSHFARSTPSVSLALTAESTWRGLAWCFSWKSWLYFVRSVAASTAVNSAFSASRTLGGRSDGALLSNFRKAMTCSCTLGFSASIARDRFRHCRARTYFSAM